MHGVRDALAYGVKVTGVSVFLVDEGVDTGPIVAQEVVDVLPDDDWDSLEVRIHAAEHRQLPAAVRALIEGRLHVDGRHVLVSEATDELTFARSSACCSRSTTRRVSSSWRRALVELGATLVSSGGTAQTLHDAGLPVTPVEEVTGVPGDARRAGEDAASEDPRRDPRRPPQAPNTWTSSPSTASSRSIWSS